MAGNSVDDTYLASMIFNTPSPKQSPAGSTLQKSPHHKSTSALNDLASGQQDGPHHHTPLSSTQSFAYHPHHKSSIHSEHSFMSDYTEQSSHHSGAFEDDFEVSPPSSVVSASAGYFSQVPRRDHHLREFDLTEDFLQHFSRERRDRHTPPPNMPSSHQTHFSPRRPNTDSGYGSRLLPVTSSPVSHKRSSSPDIPPFSADSRRDGTRYGSSSPDLYLPEPDLHQYSSSYQPPSAFSRTLPNPNQPSSHHHSNANPNWYMNEGVDRGYWHSGHRGGGGGGGGGYHSTSHTLPPPSAQKNLPPPGKNQMDESIDLQDMLKIWDESKKNPFGEGTLV